ncbi:hypothetical protein EY643_02430 [Halioglobus maricola]|uniref:asparagine synthase (glutamine-hydrolyzing) n=1 Tax=Halioglobus maricola TaxID=2601894 RepID=A0A5P9NFN9_9GAMM|nr:asparagine synthase-related protein [Halioglobus maricola]QFU74600.1 hypothetical protein EY643_02430 [Halioglobus maricola]
MNSALLEFPRQAPSTDTDEAPQVYMQGRIDNGVDVLQAYQRFGLEFPKHLLGDFAIVIHDSARQRVIAVRDQLGVQPFYYHLGSQRLLCAQSEGELLAHPDVTRAINEAVVAETLDNTTTTLTETLYRDIQRLPPGQLLVVTPDSHQFHIYWELPLYEPWSRATPEQSQDEFNDLLQQAVAARISGVEHIGANLSGGLDSTVVAAAAQQWLDQHRPGTKLKTYSLLIDSAWTEPEAPRIQSMLNHYPFDATLKRFTQAPELDWAANAKRNHSLPDHPIFTTHDLYLDPLREHKTQVLLTGEGGDDWFSGDDYLFATLWSRPAQAVNELRYQASDSWLDGVKLLAGSLGWPLLPGAMRRHQFEKRARPGYSPFLGHALMRRTGLEERYKEIGACGQSRSLARSTRAYQLHPASLAERFEMAHMHGANRGYELRFPLSDRRLVEFALRTPPGQLRRGPCNKLLLRGSGLLPENVARSPAKGDFSAAIQSALNQPVVRDTLNNLRIAELGWADQRAVTEALQKMDRGAPQAGILRLLRCLWLVFAVEIWYTCYIRE